MFLHLQCDLVEVRHQIFIACRSRVVGKDAIVLDIDECQDLVHLHRGLDELLEVRIVKQCLLLKFEWLVDLRHCID